MNINGIVFNSYRNTNFGLLTDNAKDTLSSSVNIAKSTEKLLENYDFIIDYDNKRNKCAIHSINYKSSCIFPATKNQFCTNEFLEKVLDKMSEMKNKFPLLPKREERLTLKEFNG